MEEDDGFIQVPDEDSVHVGFRIRTGTVPSLLLLLLFGAAAAAAVAAATAAIGLSG